MVLKLSRLILPSIAVATLAGAPVAAASGSGGAGTPSKASGGAGLSGPAALSTTTHPMVTGSVARIRGGVAYAPSYAPIQVQRAIWAGNQIRKKPYIWGGGHGSFQAAGY